MIDIILHFSKLVIWGSSWGRGFRSHWLHESPPLEAGDAGSAAASADDEAPPSPEASGGTRGSAVTANPRN